MTKALIVAANLVLTSTGCSGPSITPAELAARPSVQEALASVDGSAIATHVEVLASDAFEGRRPGTRGEDLALDYIAQKLATYGLDPAAAGGFLQPFSLGAHDVEFSGTLGPMPLIQGESIVAAPWPDGPAEFADAPVVFGGYGLVSGEHGRDDYDGVSLTGAVVVVIGGLPPGQDSLVSIAGYGTKQTAIAERGGVAMIVVYPSDEYSWAETRLYYQPPFFNRPPAGALPVFETSEAYLLRMLSPLGLNLEQALREAALPSFRAQALPWPFSGRLVTRPNPLTSHNVVAQIRGTDPALANEWVVLTAHWDHFGTDPALSGDQIYNGAMDNATGSATLLEIARAAATISARPLRGLRFVWTGAEEFGRLGAKAYLANPTHPDERTIAALNLDFQNPFGRAHDIVVFGPGNTTIEDVLSEVAAWQGRVVSNDPWEEEGFYRRSDHFDFAEAGIPVVFPASGVDLLEGGRERGLALNNAMFKTQMHQVSDEVGADWDYAGVEEDAQAFLMLALLIAEERTPPQWKATTSYPELARLHQMGNEQ